MSFRKIFIAFSIAFFCLSSSSSGENKIPSKRINDYLMESTSNGFSGSVLVARNDKIILSKGYGFANKEKGIKNNPQTVYDICSVTKQFTAAAILKLVEANKLKLTDSLSKYFEHLPDDKKDITIHQLLTHSAGFVHGIGGDFDHIPNENYFQIQFNSKLLFTPGTKYSYSNAGYSILARIIELVSGNDYEAYLNENLFNPAGMNQTGYLLPDWEDDQIASEYLYNVSNEGSHIERYKSDGKIAWPLKGNGGINSTQKDMYKWYQALNSDKILSEESIEKLTYPYVPESADSSSFYAYGWAVFKSDRDTKVITHNGFNGINYYEFVWFPEENALILLATNAFTRSVGRMTKEIEKMLFDKNYVAKPIEKNIVSMLYEYTENYTGDVEELSGALKQNFRNEIDSPSWLNRLGGIYLRKQNYKKAIPIFQLNTELFPDDGNIWDSMGEAYLAVNRKEEAKKSFQKALNLKPKEDDCFWCENSLKRLKALTRQ